MNESMESFANRRDRDERYRPMLPRDREDRERTYFREDVQPPPLLQRNTNYPRVRQRSPVGYEDMDRVPQGGGMPFSDRRSLGSNMLRSVPDVGSADSGFQINEREPRTKYGERFITSRDMRFRIANNSQPMSSSLSDKLPPRGPGSNLNTHRDYIPMNNSNPYYRDYPSNRYHDNRDVREIKIGIITGITVLGIWSSGAKHIFEHFFEQTEVSWGVYKAEYVDD
ncbi:3861_t:CDS:2 [Paraglomus brasilianum]|uniref:3861_t:CDS:1 n=1 Tax=Paraglomus brasilianum TaxID=144538 RepID=A0A9N9G1W5_9GLOM|nr:3861_t:CDS:2 [Paraglomus brasilianum]